MGLDTLEQYRIESETERSGWRGLIGRMLTLVGFIVLANAFIAALFFRHILAFRYQIIFAVLGGLVGLAGMVLRGNSRAQIRAAMATVMAAIGATIIVSLLEERFGWLIMLVVMIVVVWLVQKLEEHAWKKL